MDVPINVGNWRIRYYSKANWHITFTFTYQNDSEFHDKSQIQNFNINSVSKSWTKNSFLVQNNLYVKQILRGGWSGFGMVRSWDGSQLIGMNPNISSFYPKLIPTERCSTILPVGQCMNTPPPSWLQQLKGFIYQINEIQIVQPKVLLSCEGSRPAKSFPGVSRLESAVS